MPSFTFGARQARIAPYISSTSWGSAVTITGISSVSYSIQTTSAVLTGDDEELAAHSRRKSIELQMKFAFDSLDVFEVLTGITKLENSDYEEIIFDTSNFPYFGFIAKAEYDTGDGQTELWLPKVKIMSGFGLSFAYEQFVTPEMTCKAVSNGGYWSLGSVKQWLDGLRTPTIPPTYT